MGKNRALVLLHRHMSSVSKVGLVDILLTPQFYTLKREKLPVRYAYQAKRIAPSLFEGLVENPRILDYFVYKEQDTWILIAYNVHEIIDFLIERSLSAEQVGKLFFAQQIIDQIDKPIVIDDRSVLTLLNETVVIVPCTALSEISEFKDIKEITTPKKGIRLENGTESVIGRKQSLVIAGLIVLIGLLFLIEGLRYYNEKHVIEEKQTALYEEYPVFQNVYTRENIAQKYRTIDHEERAKRDIILQMAHLLTKGTVLEDLTLSKKGFVAHFEVKNRSDKKQFQELIKKTGFKLKSLSDSMFEVEGKR